MSGASPVLAVLVAGIGDLVLGRDALRALRAGYPGREVHLLTNAQAVPLAEAMGLADEVLGLPIRDLRRGPWALGRVGRLVLGLRRRRYAVAVNLKTVGSRAGAVRMGLMLRALGAGRLVGVADKGLGAFVHRGLDPGRLAGLHASQGMLQLALLAGGADPGPAPAVDFSLPSGCAFDAELDALPGTGPLIGLNPGADMPGKLWEPARFAAVGDALAGEFGARAVILGGPGEEPMGRAVRAAMRTPSALLTGRMALTELAHVLARLDLLVSNDSGPMHIAAAAGTPVAAVFGQADPRVFGPLLPAARRRVLTAPVPCRPCGRRECADPQCLLQVTPEMVLAACRELLGGEAAS